MVKVKKNLTGMEFGRLKVLEQTEDYIYPDGKRKAQWLCECSCSDHKKVIVTGSDLTRENGGVKSCGCLSRERLLKFNKTKKKYNQYDVSGEYGIGWTSNTNREFYFDIEDYDKIKEHCWCEVVDDTDYHYMMSIAIDEYGKRKTLRMHSLIVDYKLCDHIDRNPFNNQKSNLREASFSENCQNRSLRSDNTSGVTGVSWFQRDMYWLAKLTLNGEVVYSGQFADKEDAIRARLKAELKYFGKFAPQKHLFKQYGITTQNDCEVAV